MTVQPFGGAQSHLPAVQSTQLPAHLAELRAWAATYADVAQFVAPLVSTPFVPEAFRPKIDPRSTDVEKRQAYESAVAAATAAVLYGAAIGFDPITALQNVYVVGGRPGLYAAAMVAIVQAAGHEVWTEDATDSRVVVRGRRKGTDVVETVAVTIDQAKRAGWTRNAKYGSEPQAMLWARAASTVCRRIAQDALKGVAAAVEELQDSEAQAAAPSSRTVQRQAPAALTPAPAPAAPAPATTADVVDSVLGDPEPAKPVDVEKLWRQINARFVELGVTGTGQSARRLTVISEIVERPIARGSDLTAAEAQSVLDNLAGDTATVAGLVRTILAGQATPEAAPLAHPGVDALDVPGDDWDPTTEADWQEEGRPAVLDVPGDQR